MNTGSYFLMDGNVLDILPLLEPNSFDSCFCDPPYGLKFMGREWDDLENSLQDRDFCFWLAGLIDGEGNFDIHRQRKNSGDYFYCRFEITLRDDDNGILEMCKNKLGGKVYYGDGPRSEGPIKPRARWEMVSRAECSRLAYILDRCPLQSKKKKDFYLWREALAESMKTPGVNRPESMRPFWESLRAGREYTGKSADPVIFKGFVGFHDAWAREVFRVLKPGAFLMAFGGTRTYHRLICAIEDAGFEIRDCLMWLYGSGFPKSLDVGKSIDKAKGNPRISRNYDTAPGAGALTDKTVSGSFTGNRQCSDCGKWRFSPDPCKCAKDNGPQTIEGEMFNGYGTALKPAWEPIILAMKPCEGTFAQNALTHGVAGLNIDECRISTSESITNHSRSSESAVSKGRFGDSKGQETHQTVGQNSGRWPANLFLSHTSWCQEIGTKKVRSGNSLVTESTTSTIKGGLGGLVSRHYADDSGFETVVAFDCHPLCPVRLLDEQTSNLTGASQYTRKTRVENKIYGKGKGTYNIGDISPAYGDSGGASRFFYNAKVSTSERNLGNIDCRHPTLKPISLCSYLSTLLLPPSRDSNPRRLLVPFSGAGSEMIGALLAGWDEVHGIEIDPQYLTWAEARISAAMRGEVRGQAPPKEGNQVDNQEGRQDRSEQRKGRGRTSTLDTEALDVLGDILS